MYKQTETHEKAVLSNGVEISPVATLKDESGGCAHIWIDDHCYRLGIELIEAPTSEAEKRTFVQPIMSIFPEAFEVMRELPLLKAA